MLPPRLIRRLVLAPLVIIIACGFIVLSPFLALLALVFGLLGRTRAGHMRSLRLVGFVLIWFAVLAALGIWQIAREPHILLALNPYYGSEMLDCGSAVESLPKAKPPIAPTRPHGQAPAGKVLALPRSAVIDTGKNKIVYVESSPGIYDMRAIKLGPLASAHGQSMDALQHLAWTCETDHSRGEERNGE